MRIMYRVKYTQKHCDFETNLRPRTPSEMWEDAPGIAKQIAATQLCAEDLPLIIFLYEPPYNAPAAELIVSKTETGFSAVHATKENWAAFGKQTEEIKP